MDAIELARQAAASLYAAAVVRGLDPWKPYEFAIAEAKRRDIDVEVIASGAAMLDGGRATFVREDRLILHEKAGSLFEQAFLVAHEIGHAELGDDNDPEPARQIDPARPAEPSPVGIDRVVDYGRRQRREIQMDLFAREFLLPRSVARQLHVEHNMSASAIAERLGAPFEVVAQQLFDALLLPPTIVEQAEKKPERELNQAQRDAAAHRGVAYLLEAGPGTGKTQTLTGRVESLLAEGVDPRRILLLTFSNKAAGEMAERIANKHKEAAAAMWIGTFHAFGLDLIRRFHAELGLPKDPRMMDRTEAAELLEHEFPRLGLVHYRNLYDPTQIIVDILAAISRAKDEVVDEKAYADLAERMVRSAVTDDEREAGERALEVARTYAAYETLKRNAGCVDFGDLVSLPVRLLESNPAIRAHLQGLYDHVLVDEYQDVNRSSVRLLTLLRPSGENLWAVGDAKQSIYRFRGASSFNMARFGKEDFPGGIRGRLRRNYRSVSEVVAAFSTFAVGMKAGDEESGLDADRGASRHAPELRTVDRAEEQTVAVADAIEEMRRVGWKYRDQAVLCMGNETLSDLGADLERLGVPVLFLGSLFERSEVKDLLSFLTLLTDPRAMGLVRVACWPEFTMSIHDVSTLLEQLRAEQRLPGEWLRTPNAFQNLSDSARSALNALTGALGGFDSKSQPWKVLASLLLDRTRIAARLAGSANVAERARGIAIWQMMNFIRVQPAGRGLPITRLLDRIRRLLRLGDDRDLRQLPAAAQNLDAVRLMTIHGAKGLEFGVVHFPGLNSDTLPRTPPAPPCPPPDGLVEGAQGRALDIFRAAQLEEQECLFYVAMSRARDRLLMYAPTQKSNGHKRPPSPFLDQLGSGIRRAHVRLTRRLPVAPEAMDIALSVEGNLRFSAQQIALYESCARRFFYTHVLQVGGRRSATAFMQMHEAIRTVVQSVIAGTVNIAGDAELDRQLALAFANHGLTDHGYAGDYHGFARAMVRYFLSIREGHTPEAPTALSLKFGDEEIVVRPDDVLVRKDGTRTLRSIRTGHQRSTEAKDIDAAAFALAARQAFPDATVELVHLSDRTAQPVTLSPKEFQNRRDKVNGFLQEIRQGRFPANPSARTCPGCPAFFVCGPTPAGTLRKKF